MRQCKDWIETFCSYTKETESPRIFSKWTAISVIASALRKKCHFQLGRLKTYPNLYIVLVAPPGRCKKGVSMSYGKVLLQSVPGIIISAESNTRESLFQDLEDSATDCVFSTGDTLSYSALSILSKEFEVFLGQKKDNTRLLVTLTDLFDGDEKVWRHKTKHSGSSEIPNVYLNLIAGTTPSSLASSLPSDAIGGGLTSRIIFVYCDKRDKDVAIPEWTELEMELKDRLIEDLNIIAGISGIYHFSVEARVAYIEWYTKFLKAPKICLDESFAGWYERKPLFVQKLAMIHKASQSDTLEIEWKYFESAISTLEEVEQSMALAFRGVGRSDITADIDLVLSIIRAKKVISDKTLSALTIRDIDSKKMDAIISTICRGGLITMMPRSPSGDPGIHYVLVENKIPYELIKKEEK